MLSAERQGHAATEARLQETRRQLDEAAQQLTQARVEFGAQLDRERARADAAEERAASHEKRALREIDQERTARQKSDKLADELRAQVVAARTAMQESAVTHANAIGTLRMELGAVRQQAEGAPRGSVKRPKNWCRPSRCWRRRYGGLSAPKPKRKQRAGW